MTNSLGVIIVGAGISGLALAYRLQQAAPAAAITVAEQRERPGGTLWTERRDGFQVEVGPNGFLDTKPSTLALCRDLGLEDRLLAASEASGRNRYLFLDGKLHRLPNGLVSFLTTPLLSWRAKLALLTERFRKPRRDGGDESLDAFVRRRAGGEVAEVLADAFVTGIYAGDPNLLSVRAAFPRLAAFEEQHGSVLKGMMASARQRRAEAKARGEPARRGGGLWSFREGLRLLAETLAARLRQPPVLGVVVQRIEHLPPATGPARWRVVGAGGNAWTAEALVLTCPAPAQAALLSDLDPELAGRIGGIAYSGVVVAGLGYRREDVPHPLDGFGYIAPQRTRRDLLGVQWCSSIFPDRAPPGMVLLRALAGGWNRPEVVGWDDDRLLAAVRSELRLALAITAAPAFVHVTRWPRAIPQYQLGHLERVAWIEERAARYPGLFLGGNAYRGVALNDCTEQAEVLAGRIASSLTERKA
jgi:oxygen-dependent protoporphyrinogen oxidase